MIDKQALIEITPRKPCQQKKTKNVKNKRIFMIHRHLGGEISALALQHHLSRKSRVCDNSASLLLTSSERASEQNYAELKSSEAFDEAGLAQTLLLQADTFRQPTRKHPWTQPLNTERAPQKN